MKTRVVCSLVTCFVLQKVVCVIKRVKHVIEKIIQKLQHFLRLVHFSVNQQHSL